MELSRALSFSRKDGVVSIGNDAIVPQGAMTKMGWEFADPANPWLYATQLASSQHSMNWLRAFSSLHVKPTASAMLPLRQLNQYL
jgi:hypothetical protein